MLFDFYNSSRGPLSLVRDDVPYEGRCNDAVDGCLSDSDCESGTCGGLFICLDCVDDDDCEEPEHCDTYFGICRDQGEIGDDCLNNIECQSGDCYLGFCVDCNAQLDFSGAPFCSLDPAPGAGRCIDRKNNGSICVNNFECASGNCHATVCSECDAQSDCGSGEYCTLDVIPPINGTCDPLKDNGESCGTAVECESNACTAFVCGECTSDSDCPSSEHGDAFNNCVADVGINSPCLRNSVCTTGMCSAGFCAECLSHGDCNSTEFCDAGGDCLPKVPDGSACGSPVVCLSGCCTFIFVCGGLGC